MNFLKYNFYIALLVSIVYLPITWLLTQQGLEKAREEKQLQIAGNVSGLSSRLQSYVSQGETLRACDALYVLQQFEVIDFYAFLSGDISCYQPENMKNLISGFSPGTKAYEFGQVPVAIAHDSLASNNGATDWAIGARLPVKKSLSALVVERSSLREAVFKDILVVIYMFLAIMFFTVIASAKSIQNLYRSKNRNPLWLRAINTIFSKFQPKELQVIYSASEALVGKNIDLKHDRDLLETSLEQSILQEIKARNHQLPYQFPGTVAKVDINGFSRVVSSGNSVRAHDLTRYLEDFGCELLQRYHGLFEKTVGDEIVVVFKNQNSALFATAFARDLMSEFSKIDFALSDELRRFTLKSAISSSEIQFSKRAPGYGFNGDALTFASRLLEVVKEKDRNVLSCLQQQAQEIHELVQIPEQIREFEFKNMKGGQGYWIDRFLRVDEVYEAKPHLLEFFRSDADLEFLLTKVIHEKDAKKIDVVFDCLRRFKVRKCLPSYIHLWIQTLTDHASTAKADKNFALTYSKIIMDAGSLIPQAQWTPECTQAVLRIPRTMDGRVNASVIDLLISKDLIALSRESEHSFVLDEDSSFRARGNFLIGKAMLELSDEVLGQFLEMILSPNHLEQRTGIYCASHVILHYAQINPAELEIFANFNKIKQALQRKRRADSQKMSPRILDLMDQVLLSFH